jgi:hypothetical protein
MKEFFKKVKQCIDSEPELEDEMPDECYEYMCENKESAEAFCRHIVILTKKNIKERLEALEKLQEDAQKNKMGY